MPAPQGCPVPSIVGPDDGSHRTYSLVRTREGNRIYKLKTRVRVGIGDGPKVAIDTPGLPVPGSAWQVDNDFDQWAFCTQEASVTPIQPNEGDPVEYFDVENTFSTEPVALCPDDTGGFEDPLLRADVINGQFVRYTEEAVADRFNQAIQTSSFEQIRGPQVQFDANRLNVKITQNVALLELDVLGTLIDSVNEFPMWGFPARTIKFSGCDFAKHYYTDCSVYYTRVLDFDVDKNGFDRDIIDEGTKVLNGRWNRDTGEWEVLPVTTAVLQMTTTNGSDTLVLSTGDLNKVQIGMTVAGTGIPDESVVLAVTPPNVQISNNATASGTVSVTFTTEADPTNPAHFIRFKDRNGENARVILNGSGVPAKKIEMGRISDVDAGFFYTVETQTEHGLQNGDIIVINGVLGTVGLNGTREVLQVIDATSFFVENPLAETSEYLGGGGWVTGPGQGPGSIHVEKYPSADLSFLRIPSVLE